MGTGTVNSVNPPEALPTTVVPATASANTLCPLTFPRVKTRTRAVLSDRFGRMSTDKTDDVGVGSSHTVCQMPEDGV
ncbi:hypothetical protein GCM10010492_57410 [Saccharothrix mutabilis subsp. mutabilis]|uniref:Uncharacterized protein n=1 Tax=Saccharothrix mutabilis subsp. mutabilis TaxID=66855 RepID=A0ABN0UGH4_9PSEU